MGIHPDATVIIERYSDSAASFVVLDPENIPVYKQLYRAAKAKQKLKLRVTRPIPVETPSIPLPASVEDEPESATESQPTAQPDTEPEAQPEVLPEAQPGPQPETVKLPPPIPSLWDPWGPSPVFPQTKTPAADVFETIIAPQAPEDFPEFLEQWKARGTPKIYLRLNAEGVEVIDFLRTTSIERPTLTLAPLPASSASSLDSSLPPVNHYRFSKTAAKLPFAALCRQAFMRELDIAHESAQRTILKAEETLRGLSSTSGKKEEVPVSAFPGCRRQFTVCCNSCDQAVPDAHFHCSTCDDGDFDLCQNCVGQGITCYDESHWLIKRNIKDGQISNSTTHVAPKKSPAPAPALNLPIRPAVRSNEKSRSSLGGPIWSAAFGARTCNSCVQEFPEVEFVHCTSCDDYDLCKRCFVKGQHGHHPKHGFTAAVPGTILESPVAAYLSPGRNVVHNAICDGCDKYIRGIRHKCLDCPDWDYCTECHENAAFVHANHRFVDVYEPLLNRSIGGTPRILHVGICCDGPLCSAAQSKSRYISGVRYKCAICDDVDFCANCEASPGNTHNKTHPLIKFKTPVRSVSVTTTGEHEDGQRLPVMGDRAIRPLPVSSRSVDVVDVHSLRDSIAATAVQTVVDVEPTEQEPAPTPVKDVDIETKQEAQEEAVIPEVAPVSEKKEASEDLVAIFKHDTVADGTVMPPNHTFEQTWVLRNEGSVPWPAGCSVRFVGGDYMGAVDPSHPAGIHELVSASETTVCYNTLNPGQEFPFTVLMRTPEREGKVISYWRLTTRDGVKFGHKLWCDVTVKGQAPKVEEIPEAEVKPEVEVKPVEPEASAEMVKSQMIIPKLDHESPSSSVHQEVQTDNRQAPAAQGQLEDDFEDCAEDEQWAEESDDGFMTDEEYDILDASDEEYTPVRHSISKK